MSSDVHQVVSLKVIGARHTAHVPSNYISDDLWFEHNQFRRFLKVFVKELTCKTVPGSCFTYQNFPFDPWHGQLFETFYKSE